MQNIAMDKVTQYIHILIKTKNFITNPKIICINTLITFMKKTVLYT